MTRASPLPITKHHSDHKAAGKTAYVASHIKRRRSTRAEVEDRREKLFEIVEAMQPMTVRQVFYQATGRGIVEKSEAGYTKVQTDLVHMRRAGVLPYSWLADNTRWQRKPDTFSSVEHALEETARFYRKTLWDDIDAYAEVWLEKDALAGVVLPVTSKYDVPLMVARGYASLSFLHSAAEYINELEVPVYIYHLKDFDPSGVNAGELPIPVSWSKRRRAVAITGDIRPTSRPDLDNFIKAAADAVSGIVVADDSLIVELDARKRYGSDPKVVLTIVPLPALSSNGRAAA